MAADVNKDPKRVHEPETAFKPGPCPEGERFTYAQYCEWPEDERWEIIDGIAYAMSSPNQAHQDILLTLASNFYGYLKGKPCKVFVAPFDVCLPKPGEDEKSCSTVVQPDVMVVCDKGKFDGKGVKGAPDLVVEILSPTTRQKDLLKKLNVYERSQVREYWIVDPAGKLVMVFSLKENGRYGCYEGFIDKITVGIFPDLIIDLKSLFENLPEDR